MASIQKRTSPVKFAHLAEKLGKGSIPNLSTKERGDARGRVYLPGGARRHEARHAHLGHEHGLARPGPARGVLRARAGGHARGPARTAASAPCGRLLKAFVFAAVQKCEDLISKQLMQQNLQKINKLDVAEDEPSEKGFLLGSYSFQSQCLDSVFIAQPNAFPWLFCAHGRTAVRRGLVFDQGEVRCQRARVVFPRPGASMTVPSERWPRRLHFLPRARGSFPHRFCPRKPSDSQEHSISPLGSFRCSMQRTF